MNFLIYTSHSQLADELIQQAEIYTNLIPSHAREEANPLTLPDFSFIFLAPWQTSSSEEDLVAWQDRLEELLEIARARKAKFFVLTPQLEEVTTPASAQLFTQLEARLAKKKHFILEANSEVEIAEIARIILAAAAQLAAGADAWGKYSHTNQVPNDLLENFGIHPRS